MKFRVIDTKTGKDADPYEIALREEWAKQLCYCDMDGFAILEDGTLLLVDECGKFEYCDTERFKVVFEDERPHGEWIEHRIEYMNYFVSEYECSNCRDEVWQKTEWQFCPNCGADMRKFVLKEGDHE